MSIALTKTAKLKIIADDGDTEHKLDLISRKADELGAKHPELKVKIDAAAATAKLAVLREELRGVGKDGDTAGGIFTRLSGVLGGRGAGLAGALDNSVSGFASMTESAGAAIPVVAGIGGPLAVLAAILSGPLIAGLALVTAGFGTFALTAVPEISKVWAAVGKGGAAMKALTPEERQLAGPIEGLKDKFGKLAKAIQPQILKAFGTALRIVGQLLPALEPLAKAAGKAIDGFLLHISHWLRGPSGKKFLHWMEVEGPRAIKTFGKVMWITAQVVGRTFTWLRNAGDTWLHNFRRVMHGASVVIDRVRTDVVHWARDVTRWFGVARHAVGAAAAGIGGFLRRAAHDVISWGRDTGHAVMTVVHWFDALPGRVRAGLSRLPGILLGLGRAAIDGLWNGLKSAAGGLLSWVSNFAGSISHAFSAVLHIFSPSKVFERHGRNIMLGLAGGMAQVRPQVLAQVRSLGAEISAGGAALGAAAGRGGHGRAGGGPPVVIEVHSSGGELDEMFFTWLQRGIRVRGGSPAIISRKVKFA